MIDGNSINIDCGPDFRQQMLSNNIQKLDAVIFTHEHKDHTAGLDDIRAFNFKQQQDMPLYGHQRVINQLKIEYGYAFGANNYPGTPKYELHEIDNKPFNVNGVNLQPIQVFHYKLPVFGFRIKDFTYITDAKTIPEEEIEKIRGSKVLVINALQKERHISHFTLEEALDMIDLLQPEKAFLVHLSHKMGRHLEVEQLLPEHVEIAYDGLVVDI